MIEKALPRIVDDLDRLGPPWALVGGLAVCAQADPRPTADIDIAVPDDATAAARVDDLVTAGYRSRESIMHDGTGRLATVRLILPTGGDELPVDLFFASSGVEDEVVAAAEPLPIQPGVAMPVACRGHLIAVKLLWRASPKRDRYLRSLISHADAEDLAAPAG